MEARETYAEVAAGSQGKRPTALETGSKEALVDAAEDAGAAVEQLYRVGNAFITKEAQDRPYVVIGAAAGIGFILGGGLAWRFVGGLANVMGRYAVTRALEDWVNTVVAREEEGASESSSHVEPPYGREH